MEHRGAETGEPGKRMRYLELETTYSEIVVLTQSANVGTSDGLLTRLAPGTAQEGERRIVEFERTSRPNQSSGEQAGEHQHSKTASGGNVCMSFLRGRGLAVHCSAP